MTNRGCIKHPFFHITHTIAIMQNIAYNEIKEGNVKW